VTETSQPELIGARVKRAEDLRFEQPCREADLVCER
jgi:hypothetical protein